MRASPPTSKISHADVATSGTASARSADLARGTEYQYIPRSGLAMDFEWDSAKEQVNRKKHGVDFRTAAKVFLDPHVIEFDDLGATGELRFSAIGLVDDRMLFVTYTMRGDVVRIISARGAEPHEKRKYHEI
jgi:uncharacterized DUF497 family protein